ncbi:MAG: preprotein translocase subunit SecE [Candidatus Midichloria mitochondrii]|uniref:Protein translocase subunit SecE n=1 Tax=Midichloria mitochondrii (strain IricVA) TaxID=696127 RepID=F7XVV6_MIDMI|nr:preprotein translocase SecE subunit [Candidatus Midichloria mitochondrii IricVA]MDJ1256252.1 preprotein translocase subunit SecE [Candidatus Midichloria mitochondrii]MDJ1305558.1 preprotein translocase subunit SecE [Candidatus Midichloria sp.]MDJ1287949.1 preprotein translocase subunit SecE [Candidatus Midichloria mitochondrii]MDJ1298791.1 preprotein translocase subunit SecE [Candidatus Midichloria mitochondrii]
MFLSKIVKAVSFLREVKQEVIKVKWPTFREAALISLFVIIAAGLAGLLFLLVDSIIYKAIKLLLGIGG